MGRQALIAALCCVMSSGTRAVNSFGFKDQVGAESAPKLYRQGSGLVYASSVPYGAYSFQIPTFSAPVAAASKIVPVKESLKIQHANGNGYLKDSYGNRFVEALQSMKALPFKPFPQQYVQLQELPAHFAHPLPAAPQAASHHHQQYQQAPQVIVGSHYHLPLQPAAPTPINQHYSFPHGGVYSNAFKSLSPTSFSYGPHFGSVIHSPVQSAAPAQEAHKSPKDSSHSLSENKELRSPPHQSSGHRAVHIESQPHESYHHLPGEHKFQRLQEAPSYSDDEAVELVPTRQVKHKPTTQELVSAIKEIPIQTVVNGKKTIVNVETKPPLPLLDINLLEPLTFANPLVPQVQHFLPRINQATYHKLPEFQKHEGKKYQKEIVVQKTKSYDNIKPKKPKKKQKTPVIHTYDDDYIPAATARPQVTVTKALEDAPEIVYEINSPNGKETIVEKSVQYNKETNSEPVHYTYGSKSNNEPVTFSYAHSSKEPLRIEQVQYEGKGEAPKHLIYTLNSDDFDGESEKSKPQGEDSGESAELNEEEEAPKQPHHQHQREHHSTHEAPKTTHHYVPEHREQENHHRPHSDSHYNQHHKHSGVLVHHHTPDSESHHEKEEYHHHPDSGARQKTHHSDQEHHHHPSSGAHHKTHHSDHEHHNHPNSETHQKTHQSNHEHHHHPKSEAHQKTHHSNHEHHHHPNSESHQKTHHSDHEHHHPSSGRHHKTHNNDHEHHHKPSSGSHRNEHEHHHRPNSDNHHNVQHANRAEEYPALDVIPYQYEENIGVSAPIKVNPNQHVQHGQQPESPEEPPAPPAPQPHSRTPQHYPQSESNSHHEHNPPTTHVHEKSKQVYIKEERPENDESFAEQLMKAMFGKEQDKEKDFENAYKNAAYGFPAFEKPLADIEKDIYNPASYGAPDHAAYVIDHEPFQQYQERGNDFPKAQRLSYKDERDKTKEGYFLDYSVSKPESLSDRFKNKENYFKLYKEQKPEKYIAHEEDNSKQQSAKLTAIPYSYYPLQGDKNNKNQYFAQYKAVPYVFEYDYSKGIPVAKPKDNSAHGSSPFQKYKVTHFVEPQFQYGFEPIAIPRLLDSELAAMASNNSPESEKPGMRKKIYKENFYIKKTSMSDVPNS